MTIPILDNKHFEDPSLFTPESLIREAQRQKDIKKCCVPEICILDPDGDLVRFLDLQKKAALYKDWACYHTSLHIFNYNGIELGIVGNAVGASFAVLVAEELFVCGCKFLISMTSAGLIKHLAEPPYYIIIEKAVRDEGTSYHYLAPSEFSVLNPDLSGLVQNVLEIPGYKIFKGISWTTDAPFRETTRSVEHWKGKGVMCVEMESSALYAMAEVKKHDVLCLAVVTNQMGKEGDFEKGGESGYRETLDLIGSMALNWRKVRRMK